MLVLDTLKNIALEIKNQTSIAKNTASKVGGLVYDLIGNVVSKDDITSSTGTDESLVVNQKGMTDAVNMLLDKISNINNLGFSLISDRKYLYAIVDDSDRVILGIRTDGSVDMNIKSIEDLTDMIKTKVSLSGNEFIDGIKTFSSNPIVPTPINSDDVVNKNYADSILSEMGLSLIKNRTYIYAIVDALQRVIFGVRNDGGIDLKSLSSLGFYVISNRKYLYAIVDDSDRVILGIRNDGSVDMNIKSIEDLTDLVNNLVDRITSLENASINKIVCEGDSLTALGIYESRLQTLLGSKFQVINLGVGGENAITIPARIGATGMYIQDSITIPSDIDTYVTIADKSTNKYLLSTFNDEICLPLYQGVGGINPIIIDGVECTMDVYSPSSQTPIYSATDAVWRIKRNVAGISRSVPEKTVIYTNNAKVYRNKEGYVFWIGQNGGWTSNADLIAKIDKMIDFCGSKNYIVIGLHTDTEANRASLESAMINKYGLRYFNIRKYMVAHGLDDAGLTIDTNNEYGYGNGTLGLSDTECLSQGMTPYQLMRDTVHFTTAGFNLIGNQLYNMFINLNLQK